MELRARHSDAVDGLELLHGKINRKLGDGLDVGEVKGSGVGGIGGRSELHRWARRIIDNLGFAARVRSLVASGQQLHDLEPDTSPNGHAVSDGQPDETRRAGRSASLEVGAELVPDHARVVEVGHPGKENLDTIAASTGSVLHIADGRLASENKLDLLLDLALDLGLPLAGAQAGAGSGEPGNSEVILVASVHHEVVELGVDRGLESDLGSKTGLALFQHSNSVGHHTHGLGDTLNFRSRLRHLGEVAGAIKEVNNEPSGQKLRKFQRKARTKLEAATNPQGILKAV